MGRPETKFNGFIGQRRSVAYLERVIRGAKMRAVLCEPLVLIGPAGFGKTSLAKAVAAKYGSDMLSIFASCDTKASEIHAVLREVRHGDFLLIDESHTLTADAQQSLHLALDECRIPVEKNRGTKSNGFESIAEFTLILATNEPGKIKKALWSRLKPIELDRYSAKELKEIAEHFSMSFGFLISPQAAKLLAAVSQGSPRIIKSRIRSLRLFFPSIQTLSKQQVCNFLKCSGIDEFGFTPHQRGYLRLLSEMGQNVCNLERLSVFLGCDPAHIRQNIEPYFFEEGLVKLSSRRGRILTKKGVDIALQLTDSGTITEKIKNGYSASRR